MPAERVGMRQVREIIRLKSSGVATREIALCLFQRCAAQAARALSRFHLDNHSTKCYIPIMIAAEDSTRVFKTRWFAKAARKALVKDDELCEAIADVRKGQADDLGGGVFKKRLDKNRRRGIILMRGGKWWVYAYLFAKKDRENIDDDELAAFRDLAEVYAAKSAEDIAKELAAKALVEICDEPKA